MRRKICSKCKIEKTEDEFYLSKRTKDGLRERCKLCMNESSKNNILKSKNPNYKKRVKKFYNESFFEKIDTEEKAYFLGLIYSDGSLQNDSDKGLYNVNITLHIKDKDILEKFIQCVNGEMELWKHKQRDMVELKLNGKKIVNDLEKIGVYPNKTFTIDYPMIDENLERHFLRGYFDGDGCIRINTDKRDGSKRGDLRIVSGSINMLNKINERMNFLFGTNMNKLYGPKNKEYKFIGWAGMSDIEKIYNGFYLNSDLFLKRKKTIFDEVVETIKNKLKYRKK
jgi:hypothetical protein